MPMDISKLGQRPKDALESSTSFIAKIGSSGFTVRRSAITVGISSFPVNRKGLGRDDVSSAKILSIEARFCFFERDRRRIARARMKITGPKRRALRRSRAPWDASSHMHVREIRRTETRTAALLYEQTGARRAFDRATQRSVVARRPRRSRARSTALDPRNLLVIRETLLGNVSPNFAEKMLTRWRDTIARIFRIFFVSTPRYFSLSIL